MKYEVVPHSCRICLRRTQKLRSMYTPLEEGDEPPHEMLWLTTGVLLEDANTNLALPKSICKSCELSLNLAFQFRIKALKSQRIIEIYCKQLQDANNANAENMHNNATTPQVKQELEEFIELHESMEEEYVNEEELCSPQKMKIEMLETAFSDEDDQDVLGSIDKVEYLDDAEYFDDEITQHKTATETDEESNNDESDIEAGSTLSLTYSVVEREEEIDELEDAPVKTQKEITSAPVRSSTKQQMASTSSGIGSRERKSKQAPDEPKSTKRRTEPTDSDVVQVQIALGKKQRKQAKRAEDNSGHICDICGNIYAKRGRMMEHRRRHDKELKYACELCDKRFHLREKLRKHMYSHKGGKPHKCSFCSRTFFYESVKKAHEKVHSGYKPYVCEQCNKAFAYAHALSKHKLIHADIKLYHCEYCNKDFRLQHHMKQHIETKLHQNAVREAASVSKSTSCSASSNQPLTTTIATY